MDAPSFVEAPRTKQHGSQRLVPMEVLSLGFSRTGTASMKVALQILGYPNPYHFSSIFANLHKDAGMWAEAYKHKLNNDPTFDYKRHFDQLLGDAGAITDQPCILFWRELLDAYPEAKVIFVERDEDKWYPSFCELTDTNLCLRAKILGYTDPFWFGRVLSVAMGSFRLFSGTTNPEKVKANAKEKYRAYNATVKATVPNERLLIYQMGSGWEPLCKFLGRNVPDEPFPWLNESASFRAGAKWYYWQGTKNSLFNLAIIVGVATSVGVVVRNWQNSGLTEILV